MPSRWPAWRAAPRRVVAYHHYYASGALYAYCLAGFLLMVAWHVLDGTDGQLAQADAIAIAIGKSA